MTEKIIFLNVQAMAEIYGEPCNNCNFYIDGTYCDKSHRQKRVGIDTGHIPELVVRRKNGCPDHDIRAGIWWHEEIVRPFSSVYGGTKVNIIG